MSQVKCFLFLALLLFAVNQVRADGTSYVGTLANPETSVAVTFTLATASDVTLQTYGFGGGTNQAGTLIAPGGTDPFVAMFSGSGDSAQILTDGAGNALGTSVTEGNYASFAGCPPAKSVSNFGDTTCADITMSFADLAAGTYTVTLSDGQYVPFAVFDNGTLGEGFVDLTGGVFCNAMDVATGINCPNTTGAYALDISTESPTGGGGETTMPEPASLLLLGSGLVGLRLWQQCKRRDRETL